MAEVWLAAVRGPHGFRKKVVLKTIAPERATSRAFFQMFVREASLAAQLSHPGLVQVHRFGELAERPYIEMEYVAGCSLRELAKRLASVPRGSVSMALRAVANGCDGLHYLHTFCDESGRPLGLVHRDVSPENLMVAFTGHTKLLDFGILAPTGVPHRTIVGAVKGKYAYMPPEVLRGEPDSARRDLYALGVILYELTVGHRPFRGKSEAELVFRITNERPAPPHVENPNCPRELSALIMAALAPIPADRPSSAEELGRALRRILQSLDALEVEHADLAVEVASLFPERSDIPAAIRSRVDTHRPVRSDVLTPPPRAPDDVHELDDDDVEPLTPPTTSRRPSAVGPEIFPSSRRPERARAEVVIEAPVELDAGVLREAERCFERGLGRVRDGLFEAALAEWERAQELCPDNRRYSANLRTLRERIARERSR
ncbi:serine/threonine protein kinase [Myxococcota bacterium]|nr:serine/threonine protein kinase [Myxococcota bacterium]